MGFRGKKKSQPVSAQLLKIFYKLLLQLQSMWCPCAKHTVALPKWHCSLGRAEDLSLELCPTPTLVNTQWFLWCISWFCRTVILIFNMIFCFSQCTLICLFQPPIAYCMHCIYDEIEQIMFPGILSVIWLFLSFLLF